MKNIFKVIETTLIVLLVVFSTSNNKHDERKVFNDNVNKTVNLSTMALKLEETIENDIYQSKDTYTGDLTGYVYNCPMCSGRLACNSGYNIANGTVTYYDNMYGNVRIVASSSNLPCGSIVRFNYSRVSSDPIVAIVLDRGVRGNSLDLLSENMDYATKMVGRTSITYDVLRVGYGNES